MCYFQTIRICKCIFGRIHIFCIFVVLICCLVVLFFRIVLMGGFVPPDPMVKMVGLHPPDPPRAFFTRRLSYKEVHGGVWRADPPKSIQSFFSYMGFSTTWGFVYMVDENTSRTTRSASRIASMTSRNPPGTPGPPPHIL